MKMVLSLCVSLFIMVGVANAQYPVYGVTPGPIDADPYQPAPIPRVQAQVPKIVPLGQRQPDVFHYHLHEFAAQPRNDGYALNPYGCYQRDNYYVPQYNPCPQQYVQPQCQAQPFYCAPQQPMYLIPQPYNRGGARINVFGWQQ